MTRRSPSVTTLVLVIIALSVLVSSGPVLTALAQAAVPLVIVGGIVAVIVRLAWHYTSRY
jgi:hypothetical protein